MKVKILSFALLGMMFTACGPSAAEQEVHEEKREQAEQEGDDDFEDELDDMMEEEETDSTVFAESDSL